MLYLLMNVETAECETFDSKEKALEYIEDNALINCFVCPVIFVKTDEELVLYPNTNKHGLFSSVAEYSADILNDDLRNATETNPVKVKLA